VLCVGFLIVFGAVGGMEHDPSSSVLLGVSLAAVGLLLMYSGVRAMNGGITWLRLRAIVNGVSFYTTTAAIRQRRVGDFSLQNDALSYCLHCMASSSMALLRLFATMTTRWSSNMSMMCS
jgi:hypothetical protein